MFSTTLSSDPTYTFTNPPASGNAQAFSVEVTGGTTNFVNGAFSTDTYNGTSATKVINNGLDLANDGGLVWIKVRSGVAQHALFDTERGISKYLVSNATSSGQASGGNMVTSFNSNGFTLGTDGSWYVNNNGYEYVSWSFKKQAKFFDVVTYTGNSVNGRQLSHNLGSTPGTVVCKRIDTGQHWILQHRSLNLSGNKTMFLSTTDALAVANDYWNSTHASDTAITLSGHSDINGTGGTYVAYLFAHDTADDGLIKCGSYTGTGADNPVTLGWTPGWLMIKRSNAAAAWEIMDTTRGMVSGQLVMLEANTNAAEVNTATANSIGTTSTGFTVGGAGNSSNASGSTYIYMAIRGDAATDSAITWPSSVKWPSGVAPTTPASGTKDLFTFLTTDGGTTYYGKKAAEGIA